MKTAPFEPNPREVALVELLDLSPDDVVAGSFTIGPLLAGERMVTWRTADDAYAGRNVPQQDLVEILDAGPSERFLRQFFRP